MSTVKCAECQQIREIHRIGKDNSKPFYCSNCRRMVKPEGTLFRMDKQMQNNKEIKISFVSRDRLTKADIYTIEITKDTLLDWIKLPGNKVSFPIAVWGGIKNEKL